jgi:hypothetical protein
MTGICFHLTLPLSSRRGKSSGSENIFEGEERAVVVENILEGED